jgi:hypothetical protein
MYMQLLESYKQIFNWQWMTYLYTWKGTELFPSLPLENGSEAHTSPHLKGREIQVRYI